MSKFVKLETDPYMPKRFAFFIFREEFKKGFNSNNSNYRKLTDAAGKRWKLLSESDKAPYVLKAQKLKGKLGVENEVKSEESDESMADKSKSGKLESLKSGRVVIDDHAEGSNSLKFKDNGVNIKTEIDEGEDELKSIVMYFARFEEALTPVEPIAPPKATILHKHLDHLEKFISLPLETLLESANLIQFQNILKLVKDLPLAHPILRDWCNTLLQVTTVMPQQRIGIQKLLTETESKVRIKLNLQKEATDIRKTTLLELERKEECSTSIKRVDSKIESLKRQLVEAEAERATIIKLEGDLEASKLRKLKRTRTVRDDLALLTEQNDVINNIISGSKNAIKNIDFRLKALIVQFFVVKNAAEDG